MAATREMDMGGPAAGEPNKSEMIREFLRSNPRATATEASEAFSKKGIEIKKTLFYFVKGEVAGGQKRQRTVQENAVSVASSNGSPKRPDALSTIKKVKGLATDVGGLRVLKQLVDALAE